MSVNKVSLIGFVGQQPEMKYTAAGAAICNFSIATTEAWTDKKTGDKKEETAWHRIVVFGKRAEVVGKYVEKGHRLYVGGRLKYGDYQNKEGINVKTTDIILTDFDFLERKGSGGGSQQPEEVSPVFDTGGAELDDGIPF